MSETTREHLFEPFFTTKVPGRGTGMGLATCYGVVRQSGGMIRVNSELGQGSRVDVFLPAVDAPATHDPVAPRTALCGTETVLLVEDRALVRDALRESLGELGYQITAVAGRRAGAAGVRARADALRRPGERRRSAEDARRSPRRAVVACSNPGSASCS